MPLRLLIFIAPLLGGSGMLYATEEQVPGPPVFGLGDIKGAVLFSKKSAWCDVGRFFGLPTATDETKGK